MIAHAPRRFLLALLGLLVIGGAASADGPLQRMTPEAVAAARDSPAPPIIVDVRGREAFAAGTLPGAINAGSNPAGFLPDGKGGAAVIVLPPDSPPSTEAGWGRRLADFSYEVSVLKGGIEAWRAAGLPVEVPGHGYVRPGTVPFTVPRGLCEMNTPAQVFE